MKRPESSLSSLIETGEHTDWVTKPSICSRQVVERHTFFEGIFQSSYQPEFISGQLLETLSIIAYRQPITDRNRCYPWSQSRSMPAFDLIREDGKKCWVAQPLYVTTDYFLDYMGINHLEELPVIDELSEIRPRKPIIWWKDRRRWESLSILPTQVYCRRKAEELISKACKQSTAKWYVVICTIKTGDKVLKASLSTTKKRSTI